MNVDHEQLAVVLDDLASGAMTREEGEAWAARLFEDCGGTSPSAYPFGVENIDFYWTWRIAERAAFRTSLGTEGEAAEYFFRPVDFAEWAARTRGLDPSPAETELYPLRPHQCERVFELTPSFAVVASARHFEAVLGETVRAIDGLDLLDQYCLGSRWGERYLLQRHLHSRLQDPREGFGVHLPVGSEREAVLAPLIAALGLTEEAVERFEPFPQEWWLPHE